MTMVAQLPNTTRPYRYESLDSFADRLCEINHLDRYPTIQAWQRPPTPTEDAGEGPVQLLARNLEIASGLPEGTLTATRYRQDIPCQYGRLCARCESLLPVRYMCLQCAHGQRVRLVKHNRGNLCLRHRRWCGPDICPQDQFEIGPAPELDAAERRWRRLAERHRMRADAVVTAWSAAAEAISGLDTGLLRERRLAITARRPNRHLWRALAYPEVVSILELMCDGPFLGHLLHPEVAFGDMTDIIDDRIRSHADWTFSTGEATHHVLEYLRPAWEVVNTVMFERTVKSPEVV